MCKTTRNLFRFVLSTNKKLLNYQGQSLIICVDSGKLYCDLATIYYIYISYIHTSFSSAFPWLQFGLGNFFPN